MQSSGNYACDSDCIYMRDNHVMNVLNEVWIHVNRFIRSASPKVLSQDRISEVNRIAGLEPVIVVYLPACVLHLPACVLNLPACVLYLPACVLDLPACVLDLPACVLDRIVLPGGCILSILENFGWRFHPEMEGDKIINK